MPGPVSQRVGEAVAEIKPGWMPSLSVSPPAANRTVGQVGIDRHDVHLGVAQEPVNNILPGRPQPSLDDDAQLDAYGGWHQPDEGFFKMGG